MTLSMFPTIEAAAHAANELQDFYGEQLNQTFEARTIRGTHCIAILNSNGTLYSFWKED